MSPTELLLRSFKKAAKNLDIPYFAKIHYRQLKTINDSAKEIHELFYDVNWQVNRIISWKAKQSRFAKLTEDSEVPIANPSYLSFLFSGYLYQFDNAIYPNRRSIDKYYNVTVENYIDKDDRILAVISCKLKESVRNTSKVFVDVKYYVNIKDYNIFRTECTTFNIPFVNSCSTGTLNSISNFAVHKNTTTTVLENLTTELKISCKNKGNLIDDNVKIRTSMLVFEEAGTDFDYTDFWNVNENSVDMMTIRKTPYDSVFWKNNEIVKRTSFERAFIKMLEDKKAFGTMTVNGDSVPKTENLENK
jgi:hypothetical protein